MHLTPFDPPCGSCAGHGCLRCTYLPPLTGKDVIRDDLRDHWSYHLAACLTVPMIVVLMIAVWWALDDSRPSPKDRAPAVEVRR